MAVLLNPTDAEQINLLCGKWEDTDYSTFQENCAVFKLEYFCITGPDGTSNECLARIKCIPDRKNIEKSQVSIALSMSTDISKLDYYDFSHFFTTASDILPYVQQDTTEDATFNVPGHYFLNPNAPSGTRSTTVTINSNDMHDIAKWLEQHLNNAK